MNSLLQQLYHVQDFSLQLLGLVPDRRRRVDDDDVDDGEDGEDGEGKMNQSPHEEDKVLLQLQVYICTVLYSSTAAAV